MDVILLAGLQITDHRLNHIYLQSLQQNIMDNYKNVMNAPTRVPRPSTHDKLMKFNQTKYTHLQTNSNPNLGHLDYTYHFQKTLMTYITKW